MSLRMEIYHDFISAITDARLLMHGYISILSDMARLQLELVT